MQIELTDCFNHQWLVDHVRFGNMSRGVLDSKVVLSKKDIEFELATRNKDVLVEWFQYQVDNNFVVAWADADYALGLVDIDYKTARNGSIVRYDWFMFTLTAENILSLDYDKELAAMLEAVE